MKFQKKHYPSIILNTTLQNSLLSPKAFSVLSYCLICAKSSRDFGFRRVAYIDYLELLVLLGSLLQLPPEVVELRSYIQITLPDLPPEALPLLEKDTGIFF